MTNRKSLLALLMVLALGTLSLTGCGKIIEETATPAASQREEAETSIQTDTEPEETVPEASSKLDNQSKEADTEPESADTLVVYFSATGHTEPLAEYAAEYLNADIYEIVPEVAYTQADLDYGDSSSRTSKEQNDDAARPAIAGELPDISGYDTIVIGHPIWWGAGTQDHLYLSGKL